MSYQITLSIGELETLQWAANRGYFPKNVLDEMEMTNESAEQSRLDEESQDISNSNQYTYNIPEHVAWEITKQRQDDPHSLYTCIGGELLEKLVKLENSIV